LEVHQVRSSSDAPFQAPSAIYHLRVVFIARPRDLGPVCLGSKSRGPRPLWSRLCSVLLWMDLWLLCVQRKATRRVAPTVKRSSPRTRDYVLGTRDYLMPFSEYFVLRTSYFVPCVDALLRGLGTTDCGLGTISCPSPSTSYFVPRTSYCFWFFSSRT
jgi:hypothetical protein